MKKIKYLLLIVVAGLLVKGCVDLPADLILPEWDVDLTIPITNNYYTIDDFIDDQENLFIDPVDSLYILRSSEYTHTRGLLEFIQLGQAVEQNDIPLPPLNDSADIFLDFRTNVVEMDSAVFSEGNINLHFTNNSNVSISYTVIIPGVRQGGQILSFVIPVAPGETISIERDLTGYTYAQPLNQPLGVRDRFWIRLKSETSGLSSSGLVNFGVQITQFAFSSVTGTFTEQNLGRSLEVYDADLGEDVEDFKNKFKLSSANLKLTARYLTAYENPFDFRVDSLTISTRSNGNKYYLTDSTGSSNLSFLIRDGLVNINFNETNSNILELLNALPDSIEIGASFKILGKNQKGTLSNQDVTTLAVELSTRSRLALAKSTIADTIDLDIEPEDREEIRNAKVGSITIDIQNAVPLNAWIKAEFFDSSYNKLFTVRVENKDSIDIKGAVIDPVSGFVVSSSPTVKTLNLTEQEIIDLSRAYFVATSVTIETSGYNVNNPPLAAIRASDWMKVKLFGKIKYRVKDL